MMRLPFRGAVLLSETADFSARDGAGPDHEHNARTNTSSLARTKIRPHPECRRVFDSMRGVQPVNCFSKNIWHREVD